MGVSLIRHSTRPGIITSIAGNAIRTLQTALTSHINPARRHDRQNNSNRHNSNR